MKPDRAGIWEWFDEHNVKRLVHVWNVEPDPTFPPYLRVYFWGGYYNINDQIDHLYNEEGEIVEMNHVYQAEWADRWGKYVGEIGSVPDKELFLVPTLEELAEIVKENNG